MRRLELFLDAKAANTPPIGISKASRVIFSVLTLLFLSIGQMWGADVTGTIDFNNTTSGTAISGASVTGNDSQSNSWKVTTAGTTSFTASSTYYQVGSSSKPASSITFAMKLGSVQTFSKDNFSAKFGGFSNTAGTITLKVTNTSTGVTTSVGSGSLSGTSDVTVNSSSAGTGDSLTITVTSIAKGVKVYWISYTYTTGGSSTPTLSLNPTSKEFNASGNSAQAIALTASNFSSTVNSVTCAFFNAAACESGNAIERPSWVNEPTVNAGKTQVSVNVTDNTGASRQTWMKITASDGSKSASAVFAISQKKYVAPTGTFNLFSGDLVEGDYVLYYGGKALQASVTSDRWGCLSVTPSDNKITNPDATLVWHIAASGDNWTLYNAEEEKYAASTGAKNKGALIDDGTDAKAIWSVSGTYDFINVARSTGTDPNNKYLRYNSANEDNTSWACYASGTGGTLTLYKKDDGKPAAPTFSPAGGSFLEAQSVTISAVDGASIYYTTDGSTTPTASSTPYTGAINVSTTTTIKAIAVKNAVSSNVATATYTITTPLSVAAAIDLIPNANDQVDNQYVEGYVCTAGTSVSSGKMTYYISADGSETNRLQIYKGKNLNNTDFTNVNNLAIGDKVVVYGQLKNYGGTYEMNDGNYIVRRTAKGALSSVVVSGTAAKTEYSNGEAFLFDGLVATATYASGYAVEVTPDPWTATPATVTTNGNVAVTATYGGMTSSAYNVAVTVASKTLVSIAAGTASNTVYIGEALPKPTITATYSEGEPENVSTLAVYDTESVFDASTPDDYTITVSYTFGGTTKTTTYTVTVKDYANDAAHPYTPEEALYITTNVVGSTKSTKNIYVQGIVSRANNVTGTQKGQTYWISIDGETTSTEFEVYNGKYLAGADFSTTNQLVAGDEVIVKGKVIYYNSTTPEFATGESQLESLARTPNFEIADVASFEVGATDLAVADLTITVEGEGAITFANSDNTDAVTIVEGKLHAVAAGTATITANLAQNGIYKAATTTFDVTVTAATVKYAVTFDDNGKTGGSAPEAIADQAEGAEVTLPGNTWTKTNKIFDGWKVINNTTSAEITVTAGKFTMPASAVTIQAQWADPSVWALTYTSNVELKGNSSTKAYAENVKITVEEVLTEFNALRACTGSAAGSCTVKVPAGTQTLHFHAAAWNAKTSTITVTMGETELLEQALEADGGIKNSSPYTLEGIPYEYYYSIDLSSYSLAEETTITFSAGSDKRFVLFGVNQEGGSVPVLDHIAITGTMTNTTGWKTGDNIIPEGLTVTAYYTQNDAPHHNTEVTDDVTWSHAALVENQTEVTLTASYTDGVEKTANTNVTIDAVETGDPTIITDPTTQATFTATERGAALPAAKTIAVTLKNITSATATLGGTNPDVFSLSKTTGIVDGDEISVSVVSTDIEVASYSATVTIKDASGDTQKSINIYLTIKQPEAVETPVSTSTKWVPATAITNGMQVLITGAIDDDIYAMGAQGGNNRNAVKGSVDGDVFTPSDGTMAFTLIAQEGGTYAIQTSAGKYLYAGASNNNRLYTRDAIGADNNANWTVAIGALEANGSNRGVMQFNSGLFNCYASASQSPIKLYVQAYTVTFNSNEGSAVAPVNVAHGQTVAQPANPTKDNYTFVKWQLNGEDYNFATPVTADITLDAVWTPVMYTVTFNSNGGSDVASANVAYGETVAEPTAPTREGYTFNYWTLNEVEYDFDTPVTDDITLVANWTEDTPTPVYTEVRNGLEAGRHYTICLKKKIIAVKGATFWNLNKRDEGATVAYLEEASLPYEAGTPFIFQATNDNEGKLEVVYEGGEVDDPVPNGALRGRFTDLNQAGIDAAATAESSDIYMLKNNELRQANGRSGNTMGAYKAYIVYGALTPVSTSPLPAPGKRVKSMPMEPQVTTDIENINASEQPVKMMIDGQLFILRGEKLYDATGRLVK